MSLCYNKNMKLRPNSMVFGGFTLIEVAISMIFIGILSITVVLLIQNTTSSYQRGMTLNQVNTVGMDLIDEFRVAVQNSTSDPIARMCEAYYPQDSSSSSNWSKCIDDNANSFIMVTRTANVVIEGTTYPDMPVFGAFCTGTYTYIWNTGYFDQENTAEYAIMGQTARKVNDVSPAILSNVNNTSFHREGFWLLRIYDTERSICINKMEEQTGKQTKDEYKLYDNYNNSKISNEFYISDEMLTSAQSRGEDGVELLKKDGVKNDLVLYDLYIARPALSATRANMFYSGAFILGTTRGGININVVGNNCKPPEDVVSELEYCAINRFNFAVQAGGA